MPRLALLTPAERAELIAVSQDTGELIRLTTFSEADLAFIAQHRGDHNRLGIAVQLAYFRHPGRVLGPKEKPDRTLLGMVASQIRVSPGLWDRYAERAETRREHSLELLERLQLKSFGGSQYREVSVWLLPIAIQTSVGWTLAKAVREELRHRGVLLPTARVIERLCGEVSTRARREIHRRLVQPLDAAQRTALDRLLRIRAGTAITSLGWLRMSPLDPNALTIRRHLARLRAIRELGLPTELGRNVPQSQLLRITRLGAQTAAFQIEDYPVERRIATLAAVVLDTQAKVIDESLQLQERLLGSFFTKAQHSLEKAVLATSQSTSEQLDLFCDVGAALIRAKERGEDPYLAIESVLPWSDFETHVREAQRLSRREGRDALGMLAEHYGQLRAYAAEFLEAFDFQAVVQADNLLPVLEMLRVAYREKARRLPADAPTGFVPKSWARHVITEDGIDRRFYELCAFSELRNRLRAGDIWVPGSRQYRNFADYLMSTNDFEQRRRDDQLNLPIPLDANAYIAERVAKLEEALESTNALALQGDLPDAEVNDGVLSIKPLRDETPAPAAKFRELVYSMLPHVKITDLLLEVDRWTDFTRHFTHLKTGEPAPDRRLLLTAILADGLNLGLWKMAEVCAGATAAKLAWLVAWYVRDETWARALAELVNFQHHLPFARHWGEGRTSSSDGQRFRAGGRGEASGQVNARYGSEPGVVFYTHVSDQYAPFHTQVIHAAVRDATFVLDGLLYNESDLQIEEHYTDTGGFTEHVFGLCQLLGFRFAPRIRDLAERRLYTPGKASRWPALAPLVGGQINLRLVRDHFMEILRLAASIRHGNVTASLILRKLGAYPRQNRLAAALRELGRIERTLFMLDWMRDPALRRRAHGGVNKSEQHNSLARAVFFHRLGEIRDRSYENQRFRASGLNLLVAAITLWNTSYLERAVKTLAETRPVPERLLRHVGPLGWEHVALTGEYSWTVDRRVARGGFRPIRRPDAAAGATAS